MTGIVQEVDVDLKVLLYTAVVSLLSGVLFGLAPALQLSRQGLTGALNESARRIESEPQLARPADEDQLSSRR